MRRIILFFAVLMLVGGCATLKPEEELQIMVDESIATGKPFDVDRAQEIIRRMPQSAMAAPPTVAAVADPEPRHDILVRFQDLNIPPGEYSFQVQGETQLAEWPVSIRSRGHVVEDDAIADVFMTLLDVPVRWGCLEIKGRFSERIAQEDGTVRRSVWSNQINKGECIEPAPEKIMIAVPEPTGGYHVLAIVLCLITLAWMYEGRGKK